MKKLIKIALFALFCAFLGTSAMNAGAETIATKVRWYDFPTAMPDTSTTDFGTVRDNYMNRIKRGGPLATGTRVNNPLGIEVRSTGEAGDFSVSSVSNLWRFVFNPGGVFASHYGSRRYDAMLAVGDDGKVSLSRFSYEVLCGGGIALLGNSADLAALDYSVSRIGILAGPDGILFTPDDIYIQSGPGTVLVDAVLYIGARVGADIKNTQDQQNLNAAIGPDGTYAWYQYRFLGASNVLKHNFVAWLYPHGGIPSVRNTVEFFKGPKGMHFSLVGPAGSAPITLHTSSTVNGLWTLVDDAATEGASVYLEFAGNMTDHGFVNLGDTNAPAMVLVPFRPPSIAMMKSMAMPDFKLTATSSPGTELDQDR